MIEVACFGGGMLIGIFIGVFALAIFVSAQRQEPEPAPRPPEVLPDVNVRPYKPPIRTLDVSGMRVEWQAERKEAK